MTEINENDLEAVLDDIESHRDAIAAEILDGDGWMPAMNRTGGRLTLDMAALEDELTQRDMKLFWLGKVEARSAVVDHISRELLDED